jgi:hypothetical protein
MDVNVMKTNASGSELCAVKVFVLVVLVFQILVPQQSVTVHTDHSSGSSCWLLTAYAQGSPCGVSCE